MDDVISRQAVLDIVDDLRDRMTVEGYWAMVERVKALATNLQQTCNLASNDCISRQATIDEIEERKNANGYRNVAVISELNRLEGYIMRLPSAQPEIVACGDCKHWICHDRRCGLWNHGVKPLDWCCHGERRTDE